MQLPILPQEGAAGFGSWGQRSDMALCELSSGFILCRDRTHDRGASVPTLRGAGPPPEAPAPTCSGTCAPPTAPPLGLGLHQATYRPLLKLVLEEIFHPDRRDCPDIEHMSAGLTDLLKTGFSMFMKVSRPHPSDHAPLLLFLVGGVTPSELRLVRETVSAHKPSTQVLVLSTRLLSPKDVPELLFGTERLFPDIGV
ncbi:hypothetical protein ANANG_G00074500 [Anguilla anguilla]|uniref:Sec1 family domain containing 2 n=1 Tax=Anguilla anguilla TaxID=7936 RepID=A0A9D3MNR5_ANGAN|nr:hypothetical protein ANANG_G00074500 [Anguilla anguilla]